MSSKLIKKPFKIGVSRGLILPAPWCRYFGDRIDTVTVIEDGVLIIAPQGLEEVAAKMIERASKNTDTEV